MPRTARGRATRSTRSPATFVLDGHLIETYNHIDDLPNLSSIPKKRPRHATRGATAAERRADRQAAAATDPQPNGIVTRSSKQNSLRPSNSTSPLTAPSPSSEPPESEQPPIVCRVCLKSNTATNIICCSICRKGIHTFCLNPPVMHLPNDASWKCIKCRTARIPLKKEARIILRDALNTYSSLCTDKYLNAVANVVCLVSDSESGGANKNGKTSVKANGHLEPSQDRPNDNTVILRVSTDDSDLNSDVDDDIQPNPIVNSGKPLLTRSPPERSDSNHRPPRGTSPTPGSQPSLPSKKNITERESLSSSPSSEGVDDERPLSQLMSRGAQRRQRHGRNLKSKHIDPTHASPKLRLKAKQRRMREESIDGLSPSPADPKPSRDPRNLPPKRRGRKPASRRMENGTHDDAKSLGGGREKESASQKGVETRQIGNGDQTENSKPASTTEPDQQEIKQESKEEDVAESRAPDSCEENGREKDTQPESPRPSVSKADEGYPGDTEDDLPLSIRSARYRKMAEPKSGKVNKDSTAPEQGGGQESEEKPVEDPDQAPCEGDRPCEPKTEALVQETIEEPKTQQTESPARKPSQGTDLNPSASKQIVGTNSVPERKLPNRWDPMNLDPKGEALFALARVQRQRPKPGDSSSCLASSLDGESSGRLSKLVPRTNNVPQCERQRIQVTALAASNMRRNVSNMASTMAVLRPHSPRTSKGSINLLLQQNEPEPRCGITPQRSYQEHPVQGVTGTGHENHRNRDNVLPESARVHAPEGDRGKFSTGMFPPPGNPRREEGAGSSSVRAYVSQAADGASEAYSTQRQRNEARGGVLCSMEPEVQSYGKHSRDSDLLPHAKRQCHNKSDLRNMLSNDNTVSREENHNSQRGDPPSRIYTETDRQIAETPMPRQSAMHGYPSFAPAPYSFSHRQPLDRSQGSGTPTNVQGSGTAEQERPYLQQGSVRSIEDRGLRTGHLPDSMSYPSFAYGSTVSPAEPRRHMLREEDNRLMDRRRLSSGFMHREHGSDFRSTPQPGMYSTSNPAEETLPAGPGWRDTKNLGVTSMGRDYASPSAANQTWPESRPDHRSTIQESSYDSPANRFIPIDRRTRRPMPYVPTATKKALFEQGRALAFIDSRPMPLNADPSEAFRLDDGSARMTSRSYPARQEGPYPGPSEYVYPMGGRSRTGYPIQDNQTPPTYHQSETYAHRRDYVVNARERRIDEHDTILPDSRRDPVQREGVGGAVKVGSGNLFGQPRGDVHHPTQSSTGGPLEPPIAAQKGLSLERPEAPPFGPLVDARARSHQDRDMPRIATVLESDRGLPEKHPRLAGGSRQEEMGYGTGRMGNSTYRSPAFPDRPYDSYRSDRNRNEMLRPSVRNIMDPRLPIPVHADAGLYRPRDTTSGYPRRNFGGSMVTASRGRGLFDRPANPMSSSYSSARSDTEARRQTVLHGATNLDGRKEDFGADRVSNIPLVARFDSSLSGYVGGNSQARSGEGGSRIGERSISQRNEQREQLPSLRSNPSLRDLLS